MATLSVDGREYSRLTKLAERFLFVRRKSLELCAPLSHEDYLLSATVDTSPPKWHLAHTTWFFERFVLEKNISNYEAFNPSYSFLFNSYYKSIGSHLAKGDRRNIARPTIDEVIQYRSEVEKAIMTFLDRKNGVSDQILDVLEIGIHHEEQHQELLLMDIKRSFYANPMRPHYLNQRRISHGEIAQSEWKHFHEGLVEIGVPRNTTLFPFDNERDRHQVWLESFAISTHLVTNDEYLEFIEDGGYENPRHWLSDGWDLKERERWAHPLYWEKNGQDWWTFTLSGMVPLEYAAPVVHISYYEAQAFARWKQLRLPTEAEWETAATMERIQGHFLEDNLFDPESADETHELFSQIHGSVWEWTQSSYHPYPRFTPKQQGLDEYNGKFMCNQYVLRGGSCVTPKDHYRATYRNFYYPHQRWMFSGIRLAKDL